MKPVCAMYVIPDTFTDAENLARAHTETHTGTLQAADAREKAHGKFFDVMNRSNGSIVRSLDEALDAFLAALGATPPESSPDDIRAALAVTPPDDQKFHGPGRCVPSATGCAPVAPPETQGDEIGRPAASDARGGAA